MENVGFLGTIKNQITAIKYGNRNTYIEESFQLYLLFSSKGQMKSGETKKNLPNNEIILYTYLSMNNFLATSLKSLLNHLSLFYY